MPTPSTQALPKPLRSQLENTVKAAREVAETAALAALRQRAVGEARAPDYLNEDQRDLRRRLRAHARALGDAKNRDGSHATQRLLGEAAYQHWHRMLFARFLAENGLLLWEPGVAVSLDDCDALVREADPASNLGAKSRWELAGKLAARMLPQVFQPQNPVFELTLAPEHQRQLEQLLAGLPAAVFHASDSLGWVYQFWQAKRKEEVNASEVKIGADELPAVTQLFTEPYMVDFLLHNSLGAWWVTRHPGQPCPVPLPYLRTLDDGSPAAGCFTGWPDNLADFKLLDPCCGSGHFLVAAFLLLVPMRMAAEGLSAAGAVDAVLQDNLHGLELDARCVEIAVFALALAAWRYPDENGRPLGVRADMPAPRIACCGLKVAARPEDWMALVPDDLPGNESTAELLRQELRLLHASFAQAPLLGSLLDPARSLKNDLATSSFDTLRTLLDKALDAEQAATLWGDASPFPHEHRELALAAQGLLDAARLLDARYHLVVTNVPYLARGKQCNTLRDYSEQHYPDAKNDLANVFLERCLELALPPDSAAAATEDRGQGVVQIVMPQNWLFLTSYKKQRKSLLQRVQWNLLARLGEGGFDSPQAAGAFIILLTQTRTPAPPGFVLHGVDASAPKTAQDKAVLLREAELAAVSQEGQLGNPDARVLFTDVQSEHANLGTYADSYQGMVTGDKERFCCHIWEIALGHDWMPLQTSSEDGEDLSGYSLAVYWQHGRGQLHAYAAATRSQLHDMHESGNRAWGSAGVAINRMRNLRGVPYCGERFENNLAVVIPKNSGLLPAIAAFCTSTDFSESVRRIDMKVSLTNATLLKVPFDLAHWQQVAAERYPNGLPKPYSDDPTQWLFHGHPQPASDPLQVAVARLLGYRWPAETDAEMELADEARTWIARCDTLAEYTDADGIVCLPPVRGEPPAHQRLLQLLIAAWETVEPGSWRPAILDQLLADAGCAGKDLQVWLRDKFFEQHAKCFHHRPFIWHVWDGLKDGFSALVNYHRLDQRKLERLIHTYLGDWISQQEAGVRDGVDGAEPRLAAAQDLKRRLQLILYGEPPHDIFVRWKPLAQQPLGWAPDLNDGVRLNIRPFMTAQVLRHNKPPKLNVKWNKDRGKDVKTAPWYPVFKGDRINDHHLTLAEKKEAREACRD